MPRLEPITSRVERWLAALACEGFAVQQLSINPHRTPTPRRSGLTLRFGLADCTDDSVISLGIIIDVRGDVSAGHLRQWGVTRSLAGDDGSPRIAIEALITIDGDVSAGLAQMEGAAALAMAIDVLCDVKKTLGDMQVSSHQTSSGHPIVMVNVNVAGDVATGFSGLARKRDGNVTTTPEGQAAALMICDLLLNDVLPKWQLSHPGYDGQAALIAATSNRAANLAFSTLSPKKQVRNSNRGALNTAQEAQPSNHRGRHVH